MDEATWLTSTAPAAMLAHLRTEPTTHNMYGSGWQKRKTPLISYRQLRLFAEACSRVCECQYIRLEHWLEYVRQPNYGWDADCKASAVAPHLLREICGSPFRPVEFRPEWKTPTVLTLARAIDEGRECERCGGTGRRIVGMDGNHGVNTTTCLTCHGSGRVDAWDTMPILADALEEAGCTNDDILDHCRGRDAVKVCPDCVDRSPDWETNVVECGRCECAGIIPDEDYEPLHCRGCWAISAIRGEE